MKIIMALSYFHHRIGPSVFYSYPKNMLDKEVSVHIANKMEWMMDEGFFKNLISMNYYFEIHSEWARQNKEMVMISINFDELIPFEIEEKISNSCTKFSKELQSNKEIFTGFYINDINKFNDEDQKKIEKNEYLIKAWVDSSYWAIIDVLNIRDTREKSIEQKIAFLMLDLDHEIEYLKKLRTYFFPKDFDNYYNEHEKKDEEEMRQNVSELFQITTEPQLMSRKSLKLFNLELEFLNNYKGLKTSTENAIEKIENTMRKEAANELVIRRKYLQELFDADLLEISKNDGFPKFKPVILEYFKLRGILTEFSGNIMKIFKDDVFRVTFRY